MTLWLIVVLIVAFFVAGIGIKKGFTKTSGSGQVTSGLIAASSRAEIEDMLEQLDRKDAPEEKMGAMCYEVAPAQPYFEYACPIDGEKTVYNTDINDNVYWFDYDIVGMRRQVKQLNSVTNLAEFELDERRLCHKCFPGIDADKRYVVLITKYPDGKESAYDKVMPEDLRILTGFFEHKLLYKSEREAEYALKKQADKIKKILGLEQLP